MDMIRKTVWVDPNLWKKARILALAKSEPFCALLERALKREVEKFEPAQKKEA